MLTSKDKLKILIKEKYLSVDIAKQALKKSKTTGVDPIEYLLSKEFLSEELIAQAIAEYYGLVYNSLKDEKIDEAVLMLIPEIVAINKKVIAFERENDFIKVGLADPGNLETRHLIEKRLNGEKIKWYYITEHDLKMALSHYSVGLKKEILDIIYETKNRLNSKKEIDDLTVKLVNRILQYGYESKASDIHIEPYETKIIVRFRIDGVMHDVLDIPKELESFILTRIKILSKMRTDEHKIAQDGKMRFETKNGKVDVRVSVLPVTQGENAVMRILSSNDRHFSLINLGLSKIDLVKVKKAIKNPHGMILVTGPTGSGKSTTLYTVLKILNKREVNIATIEDPVEYDIPGVSQIQVNNKTGLTFASGLRALVRQDPDIIMVGEIRDSETANIAINSALTGHLVLSTLHTNDSATTLPRLVDMGIEPFLVASTVKVIIAQRLVRKICPRCKKSYRLTEEEIKVINSYEKLSAIFKSKNKNLRNIRLYKGSGCKVCNNTGYTGRIGVFEVLEMDDEIKELVLKNASSDEITELAHKQGMTIMLEDATNKMFGGITTLQEVLRVTAE